MKSRGHRDALLANILQWLWWLENGHVVGLYCNDVSGAFDGVDCDIMEGTICGPPLWNLHYESTQHPVNTCGYREVVYANDKQG